MTEPLWRRDAGLPSWSPLGGDRREAIVIVGAGLAGLGLARALAERGHDPLVVDAEGPAAGASGRNAGFVLRTHVTDYPMLRERVGVETARELLALARENHERVARIAPSGTHRRGSSLMLAAGHEEVALLVEAQRLLASDGVRTADAPIPRGLAGFDAGIRIDDDGEVHPGRLLATLAQGVRGARARGLAVQDGGLVTDDGRIAADHVVLATNAWTGALVPELAALVTPQRAQMLATAPVPRTLEVPCYATLGFDYFRQRDDGRVLLGGRRHLFLEAEATDVDAVTAEVQAALEAYLETHLPFARGAAIEARWAGIMAFSADGLPLAGRVPVGARPWVLAGWTGHGLGLSLAVADRLADAIVAGAPPIAALDPARFFGR